MVRLPQAIGAVMAGTLAAGLLGGAAGAAVGRLAPSFVRWLFAPNPAIVPADLDPIEFGLGLGAVCGLFLGTGACVVVVVVLALRDAYLAGRGVKAGQSPEV